MFRINRLFLVVFLLLILPTGLFAAKTTKQSSKPYMLEVSWMYYYFGYEEDLEPPEKSKERGWLNGGKLALSYKGTEHLHNKNNIYSRIFLEYTQSETTYDGSLIDLSTGNVGPFVDRTNNIFFTIEGDLGLIYPPAGKFYLIPYLGLGMRSWERQLRGENPFKEIYSWLYLPLGLQADYKFTNDFAVSMDFAYKIMFLGKIKFFLSELNSHFNDPIASLGNLPGWRISVPIKYRFIVISPWYEYSAIGESSKTDWTYTSNGTEFIIGEVYEPASEAHQNGINIGVAFSF